MHDTSLIRNVRAILWTVAGAGLLAGVDVIVRIVNAELPPVEIVFFRNFFSMFVLLPFFLRTGLHGLHTQRLGFHVLRGGFHAASMVMWFTAVTVMPLAQATAISFMIPIYTSIGATLFLAERARLGRWVAIAIGMAGMLVIVRPGLVEIGFGTIMVTGSAIFVSVSKVMTKSLAETDSAPAIVAYMTINLTIFTFVPSLFVWEWPSMTTIAWLVVMAILGTFAHLCLTQAYREGELTAVEPANFVRLIWAASIAFLVFGEIPEIWTWIGSAIILVGTVFLMRWESRDKRVENAAGPN